MTPTQSKIWPGLMRIKKGKMYCIKLNFVIFK